MFAFITSLFWIAFAIFFPFIAIAIAVFLAFSIFRYILWPVVSNLLRGAAYSFFFAREMLKYPKDGFQFLFLTIPILAGEAILFAIATPILLLSAIPWYFMKMISHPIQFFTSSKGDPLVELLSRLEARLQSRAQLPPRAEPKPHLSKSR